MSGPKNNSENKNKNKMVVETFDYDNSKQLDPLSQIFAALRKNQDLRAIKLSFSDSPTHSHDLGYIYKKKDSLIPNLLLKRVRDTEELIGGIIIPLKANQISLFGRPRPNRFDIGFTINIKPEVYAKYDHKEIDKIKLDIIPALREIIINCGRTSGLKDRDKITFSQYLKQIVEDMYTFGWWATEIRYDYSGNFHSFRAVDAGTIYYAMPSKEDSAEAENIRRKARDVLAKLDGHKIPVEEFSDGEYTWVQVIDEQPYQVFNDDQLVVWSLNPSTDIMRNGYPVTFIERIISAVTAHINLVTHNKMFFVNGRASKSMMVIRSDNIVEEDINAIRQQMSNHINTPGAAWRMPVFSVSSKEDIQVLPLDPGGRDMEFQYMADLNKRMILAAFQVSPDEIAALSYLSRGTNAQALAESNNEWKLLKSQESGLRPVLNAIEDFINERLLPKINPEWAKYVSVYFQGLDADSPEKEAALLNQASDVYFTYNDIMSRVEKESVPIGGDFPLNPKFLSVLERYYTMGEILEAFGGEKYKGASKDPKFSFYIGNPAWFQHQNFLLQQQQLQQQQLQIQQAQQAQQAQQGQPQKEGQESEQGMEKKDKRPSQGLDSLVSQLEHLLSEDPKALEEYKEELDSLTKSEKDLPPTRKRLLAHFKKAKKSIMKDFEKTNQQMVDRILGILAGKVSKDDHGH